MKNKIFLLFAALAFVGSVSLSINASAKGDNQTAVKFALVAGVTALSTTTVKSGVLGAFGNPGLEALTRNADRFGNKTKEQFANRNVVAYDDEIYVRAQVTGIGGIFRLIEAKTIKTLGLVNVDKNRLPEGENFAIEKIWIAEGNNATEVDPTKVGNYTNVMSSVQVELRHAELVITQDSKQILRLPVSALLSAGAIVSGSKKDTAYSIEDNCPVLIENVPFEINIEFPAAMGTKSASANKFHVEVELFGKKTGRKYA